MSVNNISKIMQYVEPISRAPVIIDGKVYDNQAVSIKLNKNFLLSDSCDMCGKCCINEANIFTKSEMKNIIDIDYAEYEKWNLDTSVPELLKNEIQEIIVNINGNNIPIYKVNKKHNYKDIPDRGNLDRCKWLVQKSETVFVCGIHPVVSITCDMPHLRFFFNRKTKHLSLGVAEYGRNQALKCPAKFDKTRIDFKLSKLYHLQRVCDDLKIDTRLPEIISYIKKMTPNNYMSMLDVDILNTGGRRLF